LASGSFVCSFFTRMLQACCAPTSKKQHNMKSSRIDFVIEFLLTDCECSPQKYHVDGNVLPKQSN